MVVSHTTTGPSALHAASAHLRPHEPSQDHKTMHTSVFCPMPPVGRHRQVARPPGACTNLRRCHHFAPPQRHPHSISHLFYCWSRTCHKAVDQHAALPPRRAGPLQLLACFPEQQPQDHSEVLRHRTGQRHQLRCLVLIAPQPGPGAWTAQGLRSSTPSAVGPRMLGIDQQRQQSRSMRERGEPPRSLCQRHVAASSGGPSGGRGSVTHSPGSHAALVSCTCGPT